MESFKALQDTISAALVSTTRSATQLSGADIPFQRSLNPALGTVLDEQNARLLRLAQRLLENAAGGADGVGPKLPDVEAIDGNWRGVVDIVDSLLEKADTSLDEYTGVVKRLTPSAEQAVTSKSRFAGLSKQFPKPQILFEHVPQNNETGGFRPLLTSKPHAKVPLAACLKAFKDDGGKEQYPHPYQTEIEAYEYPPSMYQHAEPQMFTPFESTTATFVDTPEALAMMLAELKTAKEIAIDLEHHDNRSYIGIVSLMQISTRNQDWIVDTLKPWRRRLECLNEVFADPNILKVLHGAFMDALWLQRDLGLYLVGLLDTYHACRALGYPGASLAFLLDKFVNFKAQKQYQTADWRVRPLPDELFTYARADTHFLLYIFDNIRNELISRSDFSNPDRNKIQDVLVKSKEVAMQRYEHPIYDLENGLGPVSWYRPISRTPVQMTPQQFSVFRAVHKWRDDVARQEDESTMFIMPHHAVFTLARQMPDEKTAIFSQTQHVSHILRLRVDELIAVIKKAKIDGMNGPDLNDTIKKISDMQLEMREARNAAPKVVSEAVEPGLLISQYHPDTSSSLFLEHPPLRTHTSQFWGNLLTQADQSSLHKLDITLAVPLPPLTAEVFINSKDLPVEAGTPQLEKSIFAPEDERAPEVEQSNIFIVKQLGGKRKRPIIETPEEHPTPSADLGAADEVMLETSDGEDAMKEAKARRKAERKEKKRLKALAQASGNPEAGDADADEPAFDYANAPSVLNARGSEKDKKRDKKKKKNFNPYSGMTDAPKGLPRSQKESAGKSKTFTS
ncbi:hypothetical protein P154DRAFT_534681 [Amniculicola lignicola CBS 123094]|uniref:HRDC domain-containing protein n=1 Tax=Amniculicola lignicola CBS 123094 TaxID=1392246 RepID=A0A6A5WHA7_9PLEO|nr:hypothetical protein P154DRAFT_534681 [Amniculicola lignicola CBS 123094]